MVYGFFSVFIVSSFQLNFSINRSGESESGKVNGFRESIGAITIASEMIIIKMNAYLE